MTLVDRIPRFDAHWSHFFAEFDWFVVLTSRLDAYISRYGDFCANDDDDTTDYFTPCACARGNNWKNTYTRVMYQTWLLGGQAPLLKYWGASGPPGSYSTVSGSWSHLAIQSESWNDRESFEIIPGYLLYHGSLATYQCTGWNRESCWNVVNVPVSL